MARTAAGRLPWGPWTSMSTASIGCVVSCIGVAVASLPRMWLPFVLAVAVAILAQAAALRFRQGNRVVYLGWGEAALIIVTFLVPSGWVAAIIGAGALVGQLIYRLRTGTPMSWRVVSNTGNLALAAAAGTFVAHAVVGGGILMVTPRSVVGLAAGACVYCLIAVGLASVAAAQSLPGFLHAGARTLWSKIPIAFGNLMIGVAFVAVFERDRRWLLISPAILVLMYQTYLFRSRAADERRLWREFAEITRSLHKLDERGVAVAAVTGIQRLFLAAAVEVWVDRLGGSARGYRGRPLLGGVEIVELIGRPIDHPALPDAVRALAIGGVRVGEVRVWMTPGSTLELRDHMAMSAVCEATAAALHDASAHRALRALAARSFRDARHDILTGIPNRATLVHEGTDALAALPVGAPVAVFLLGINRFKEVNDSLGHLAGDDLLRVTATRMAAFAGPGDFVARLTGDKFALLATTIDAASTALVRAGDLADQLAVPTEVAGLRLAVEVSIGVTVVIAGDCAVGEMLRQADIAMHRGKADGAVITAYGSDDSDVAARDPDRLSVVLDLRVAIERTDQLVLHVQPAIDLDTGAPRAIEALVRWRHPRRGLLAPAEFVDTVDASDLVAAFTRYVLDQALALANRWAADGISLPVSVNLSPRSLADSSLPTDIEAMLKRHSIAPHQLMLEITEGAVIGGQAVVEEVLTALRTVGVQVAVDDFGTGYSSLTFLTKVQVDEVKVDSSFVGAMISSPQAAAIVRTTLDLGRRLGLRVVAEGVETAAQRAALRDLGCEWAQGRHLVPPLPPSEAIGILRTLLATATPNRVFPL